MSLNFRFTRGRVAAAAAASAVVVSLIAVAAEPLDMLDDVIVTAKTVRPLEDFVEFAMFDSVAISPDGKKLAMGWQDDKTYVRQLLTVEFPSMKRLDNQELPFAMGVTDIRWASNTRVLVQPDYPVLGFLRRRELIGSVFVIDTDRHQLRILNSEPTTMRRNNPLREKHDQEEAAAVARAKREARGKEDFAGDNPEKRALGPLQLISARTVKPEHMMFQTIRSTNKSGRTDGYGAYYLDMKAWDQTRISTMPVPDARYVTGPDGQIALAYGYTDHNEQVVYYMPAKDRAEGTEWKLITTSTNGDRGIRPIAWMGTGEEYYAFDNRGKGTNTIVAWNPETNTTRKLHHNDNIDMEGFSQDPSGKPYVFSGTDHFPAYWYPDPEHPLAVLHKAVAKKARDEQVDILSTTDDMSMAVVRVSSGRRTPIFNVMDVKTAKSMYGMQTYPKLRATRLEPVDPIEFRARDGLMLRGYLTTPTSGDNKPRTGLPLVVLIHDGPESALPIDYQYQFERQLLASRGYAVLQVNHRGMPGRGGAFERAGDGKWGREVQDDLVDGVRWAIKDGVAASGQVCIYGYGWGAYSAMMAASREPTLFNCVIGIAGVYDLPKIVEEFKPEMPASLQQVLGSDMEMLRLRSPVNVAPTIKAKVLLIGQPGDETISPKQTVTMAIALKEANANLTQDTIGTSYKAWFTPQDRTLIYTRMIKFLDQSTGKESR